MHERFPSIGGFQSVGGSNSLVNGPEGFHIIDEGCYPIVIDEQNTNGYPIVVNEHDHGEFNMIDNNTDDKKDQWNLTIWSIYIFI